MTIQMITRSDAPDARQLVLRNTTSNKLVVKLVHHPNIRIKCKQLALLPGTYTIIDVDNLNSAPSFAEITVYARVVTKKMLRAWLSGELPNKSENKVETIKLRNDDMKFASDKTIIDLPGKATVHEASGFAVRVDGKSDRERFKILGLTCDGTDTARQFNLEEAMERLPSKTAKLMYSKDENCQFMNRLCQILFPVHAEKSSIEK